MADAGTEDSLINFIASNPNATQVGLVIYEASRDQAVFSYNILFNASYNVMDIMDIRRKPDGRNEVRGKRKG